MSPAVPDELKNQERCLCRGCPSFVPDDKGFYCALGKSEFEVEKLGCLCEGCGNYEEYELENFYFDYPCRQDV